MSREPLVLGPERLRRALDDVNGDGLDDLVQVGIQRRRDLAQRRRHVVDGGAHHPELAARSRATRTACGSSTRTGTGRATCSGATRAAYKFIDLQGGVRPWVADARGQRARQDDGHRVRVVDAADDRRRRGGQPWTSVTPNAASKSSRRSTERDNLDAVGQAGGVYVTQYAYRNPVYDGRQREFRGFQTATTTRVGDANSPTSTTSSTFLLGQCKNDENLPVDPCSEEGRWEDNPSEALKGLAVVSETSDANGEYPSSAHLTYRLRSLYQGLDGREVRHAFESQADSFLYDDGPFVATSGLSDALTDVELELSLGNPGTDTQEKVALRAAGAVHLHTSTQVDFFGNVTQVEDDGNESADTAIVSNTVPLQVSPGAGWTFRTGESWVDPGTREHTFIAYDNAGSQTVTKAVLQGTASLSRFYSDGTEPTNGVAPPPASASQDGTIVVSVRQYDPVVGVLTQETGPNFRCNKITYDTVFEEVPVLETTYVGAATADCTGTPLNDILVWDRGLDLYHQKNGPERRSHKHSIRWPRPRERRLRRRSRPDRVDFERRVDPHRLHAADRSIDDALLGGPCPGTGRSGCRHACVSRDLVVPRRLGPRNREARRGRPECGGRRGMDCVRCRDVRRQGRASRHLLAMVLERRWKRVPSRHSPVDAIRERSVRCLRAPTTDVRARRYSESAGPAPCALGGPLGRG